MNNLVFPMFTRVSQSDGVEDKQLCWESYHKTPDWLISKQSSKVHGESVVAMVLPFSNRIVVTEYRSDDVFEATFLNFGIDYEEFESGGVPFSVAIFMKDDGQMGSIAVHRVKFIQTTKEAS